MSGEKGKGSGEGSSRSAAALVDDENNQRQQVQQPAQLSRYESQKRRDWNTFGQYLKNQRPPVPMSHCNYNHILDFLRYLDQFGKTKVHLQGCVYFGQPEPPGPCACPLRQAWGSLDALIGRLRAAYEENGGLPESNPFASGAIRIYLREVRDSQAKARGIPYKKKKKKKIQMNAYNDASNPQMQVFVLQWLVFMVIRGHPGSSFVRSFASRSLRGELWFRLVEKFRCFVGVDGVGLGLMGPTMASISIIRTIPFIRLSMYITHEKNLIDKAPYDFRIWQSFSMFWSSIVSDIVVIQRFKFKVEAK
ncbi:hypothetical protein TEA_026087 [Camellia sinensis var. sinensis]|uniref:ALOG domain-containing protein n=1 Tax=Camellia sinensis var. sinensis TaxID=542762 RepID=A0A4V3WQF7_CAMSN|nr:hypothetical protein TEA_026087 [Camellia sinensis var. sinensis]